MDSVKQYMTNMKKMDTKSMVHIAILVVLVLYISFGVEYMPNRVLMAFRNKYFNFVMFAILAIVAYCCPCVGVLLSVALMMTISAANFPILEGMENVSGEMDMPVMVENKEESPKNGDIKRCQYRNEFYPQYVNADYFAYDSKNDENSVVGFDQSSRYDTFNADNGSRSGINDGVRSTLGSNRSTYN